MRDELNYVHACGGTFNGSAALLLAKHGSLGCRRPSAFLLPALLGRVHHQAFELADGKFKLTEGRRLWIKLGEAEERGLAIEAPRCEDEASLLGAILCPCHRSGDLGSRSKSW